MEGDSINENEVSESEHSEIDEYEEGGEDEMMEEYG